MYKFVELIGNASIQSILHVYVVYTVVDISIMCLECSIHG